LRTEPVYSPFTFPNTKIEGDETEREQTESTERVDMIEGRAARR
jgi:hypothetical protein